MPDPADKPRCQDAAGDEAACPGGSEQPKGRSRETLRLPAQRQEQAMQACRCKQEAGAAKKRQDGTVTKR